MDLSLAVQYLIIAVAVVASAWVVATRQFPHATRRARGRIALFLLKPGRAGWLQALGRRIAPPSQVAGGSCGGCDGCGPAPPK